MGSILKTFSVRRDCYTKTVYALNLEPGMIIKCGFMVLLNTILSEGFQEITFLTGDGTVYSTKVSNTWDYEVFR